MASVIDLTNISRVKLWLGVTESSMDAWFSMALTSTSGQIMSWLERNSFVSRAYTDVFDGQGNTRQFLENYPVSDITSVSVDSSSIVAVTTAVNAPATGYRFEDWEANEIPGNPTQVELIGYTFCKGHLNCSVTYNAGYLEQSEAHVVGDTSSAHSAADQPRGVWIADNGVTYASGAVLTKVAATPAVGQYALNPTVVGGYIFNVADNGASIKISYSFCPYAVEQVVIEMINEVRSRRGRPGAVSRNLAGQESATFESKLGIPAWAALALQPFKSVIPV